MQLELCCMSRLSLLRLPVDKAIHRPNTYSQILQIDQISSVAWIYNKRVQAKRCLFVWFLANILYGYWMPCFDCLEWSGNIDILVIGIWFCSSSIQSVRCSTRSLGNTGSRRRGVMRCNQILAWVGTEQSNRDTITDYQIDNEEYPQVSLLLTLSVCQQVHIGNCH